jgi:hypothetical protein
VGAIDVRLAEVHLAALAHIFGEPDQRLMEHAALDPRLEPTMARLIGRVTPRHVGPRRASPQNPKHAVDHVARVAPWAPALVSGRLQLLGRKELRDRIPLFVGEVHRNGRSENAVAVDRCRKPIESRQLTSDPL